jgi:hypothetical protein
MPSKGICQGESIISSPKTADKYLATLEKQKLPKTVAFLREYKDDL